MEIKANEINKTENKFSRTETKSMNCNTKQNNYNNQEISKEILHASDAFSSHPAGFNFTFLFFRLIFLILFTTHCF